MNIYYQAMDWPQIPKDLVNEIIEYSNTATNIIGNYGVPSTLTAWWMKTLQNINPKEFPRLEHFEGTDNLKSWVRSNIPVPHDYEIKIQKFSNLSKTSPIHIDAMRKFSYNYLLAPCKAKTNWFDNDFNMVESVQYKQDVWYRHTSDILHNVTEGEPTRIAVTLFKQVDAWKEFKDI